MYYLIEGQDSTGKSTQAKMLARYLRKMGREVEIVEEPGGKLPSAQIIRRLLKNKKYELNPYSNVFLFMAARVELWNKRIQPVLDRGGDVISTRNWWSTLAYQHFGQGIDKDFIQQIVEKSMPKEYVFPEKSVIFVLKEAERMRRQKERDYASNQDAFESQPSEFQMRVNNGYLEIAKMYDVPICDASGSLEQVRQDLWKHFGILQPTTKSSESAL